MPAPQGTPDPTMAIVPTLDWMLETNERLVELEAQQPAEGSVADRLDRHRVELEAIKTHLNALIRYVTASGTDPRAIPDELQAAPTMTAPDPEEYQL